MAKVVLARYASRQAAQEVADRLERDGFAIRPIATPAEYRVLSGSTIGWCAFLSHKPRTRLFTVLKRLFSRLHRSITSAELLGLGIPPEALIIHPASRSASDHIVIVAGTPGQVMRGVWALKAHQELLKLDLY